MLKVKDTYINLNNVIFIEQYINDFETEYIIDFIFGQNYCYNAIPYIDNRGFNKVKESSSYDIVHKKITFTNKEEFEEILSKIEKVED